ncbi:LytTR family DNA-binding domain-containing protein [Pedobacter sp. ASV28]|uniref:LytR/AlgR family response regulator transcription factor n=1 Tax=Pedobacter sp. ASV28 TaxID=2795123 RepID=UPI0018EC95CE|nr:LytTR family DNA-binding domain-containing protein [Pedobacter sp. ASV28]
MINCFSITERDNQVALAAHLEKYPLTRLVGSYRIAPLIYSDILELGVQLVFIDQSLVANFKVLLSRLSQHVSIVYLAEDKELAFQAFEDGVLDFITYPYSFARLEKCINKFVSFSLLVPLAQPQQKQSANVNSFFVKPDSKGKIELLINCNDVLFIEAFHNDVAIHMVDGRRFVCYYTMKEMEDLSDCFMRVHKSYIINYNRMSAFDGANIIIKSSQEFRIPLGGVYKKAFFDKRSTMVIRKQSRPMEGPLLRKVLGYLMIFMLTEINLVNELLYI